MALEEEIKLTAPSSSSLDAVAMDPALVAHTQKDSPSPKIFLATYYDTEDRLLLRHKWAFRTRLEGEGTRLKACLKGTGVVLENGLSRRQEWEESLSSPLACWGALPPGELREQVLAIVAPDAKLVPLLVTDFHRRVKTLKIEETLVELALDRGEIRAGGAVYPLLEVELELLQGHLAPLQSFAKTLSQKYHLVPSSQSKFGLGLSLLGLYVEGS